MADRIYRKLGGQTIVYGIGTIVPRLLNYVILTFYFTRKLEISQYGIMTEFYAYVAVLIVVFTFGLETGFFKFYEEKIKEPLFRTIVTFVLFMGFFSFFILLIFVRPLASNFQSYKEIYLLLGFAIVFFDALAAIFIARLRMLERIPFFVFVQIGNVCLTIGLVLVLFEFADYFLQFDFFMRYFSWLLTDKLLFVFFTNAIVSFIRLLILVNEKGVFSIGIDKLILRKVLLYSLPLLAVQLSGILNEMVDRIMLRYLIVEEADALYQLGIYGANFRIAMLMTIFIQMFRYAADPFFFSNYKNIDAKRMYADVMKYFVIFCFIIFLVVTLYLDIFKHITDIRYHEGLHIVPVVLVASICSGIIFNLSIWYKLSASTLYGLVLILIGLTANVLLNLLLVPHYGYIGCAYAHLMANGLIVLLSYFLGKRFYAIPYNLKAILTYTLIVTAIYLFHTLFSSGYVYIDMVIDTVLFLLFLYFVNYREKLNAVFFKSSR